MSDVLVRIIDDDPGYDKFVLAPPGMAPAIASALVDSFIRQIHADNVEEYLLEDLEALLERNGFVFPLVVDTTETW